MAVSILVAVFGTYGLTALLAESYACEWFRWTFRKAAIGIPFLGRHFVRTKTIGEDIAVIPHDEGGEEFDDAIGYDFISCRQCVGFWVALVLSGVVTLFMASAAHFLILWLVGYGASWWMANLER